MRSETKEKLKTLAVQSEQANANLYQRVRLAFEILGDNIYLAEEFDGDQDKAATHLGNKYFAALCGYVPLLKLIAIYKTFSGEASGRENNYDIRAMEILYDRERQKEESVSTQRSKPSYKAQAEKLEDEVEDLMLSKRRLERELEELKGENSRLKGRVEFLQRENSGLQEQLLVGSEELAA